MAEIKFKKVELGDRELITEFASASGFRCDEYCFTSMFVWQDYYGLEFGVTGDRLVTRLKGDRPRYSFPLGKGDLYTVIEALREDARRLGFPLSMRGIPKCMLPVLKGLYPGLDFTYDRDESDYMYSAEKLATLSGKKLHAKRNHINRFVEQNDWCYEPVTRENLREVVAMTKAWLEQNYREKQREYIGERMALARTFGNFDALGLEGGLIRSGGRVIAYTLGEKLTEDTYVLHFEKAFPDIQGAYAMINRENAKRILENHPEIVYINREEDMGLEGLRKAKESYFPEFLEEKYSAVWDI